MNDITYWDYSGVILKLCYVGGATRIVILLIQLALSQLEENNSNTKFLTRVKHTVIFLILAGLVDVFSALIRSYYYY